MPWVRGAASARPVPAGTIMLATRQIVNSRVRPPAALPSPPFNSRWFPRLGTGKAASQVFRPRDGAAFSALPGLPFAIPDPLTLLVQLGPLSLVYIECTNGGNAQLSPLLVGEAQPRCALVCSIDPFSPQRLTDRGTE
jgi:hypothetical protein